jgi:hypothetical protein
VMARSADNRGCRGVRAGISKPSQLQKGAIAVPAAREAGVGQLTEDSTGRIVTGETGLAHTRTRTGQLLSI